MIEVRVVRREFLAFKDVFIVFSKQIKLLFIVVHLENSRLKPGFQNTISILFLLAGREY